MEYLNLLYNDLKELGIAHPYLALGLNTILIALFFIQLYYYLSVYGSLPHFRNNRGIRKDIPTPPISVIIVIRENSYYFIEETLPLLLQQQYDAFEIVLVDCSFDEEIAEILAEKKAQYPDQLHVTRFKQQLQHEHSIKLALTVGIKAARYEHLLFTTPDCVPASDRWIALMAKGFISGDIVIGYCGIEQKKGLSNRWIRCSRFISSVRYLSSAVRGYTYRGTLYNIGYTKSLYFGNKGFTHLNMDLGVDDLFIQKVAHSDNVSVIMNPNASVRQFQYGGIGWWYALCKYLGYAYRYYPGKAKRALRSELVFRFLFFGSVVGAIIVLPLIWKAIPLFFLLLRLLFVELTLRKVGKRLGEHKFLGTYILFDLWAPIGGLVVEINRMFGRNKAIWH